jgi:hypothetical protein
VLPVRYKQPRAINLVSVTVVLLLVAGGYAAWEYGRVMFRRQEAYRVLEETGSALLGRSSLYREDAREREALRKRMAQQLREVGVTDPDAETWIDVESSGAQHEARCGVVYTAAYHWPFDVLAPIERDIQIEHTVVLPR